MSQLQWLPEYGPLEIEDMKTFLKQSKEYVLKNFDAKKHADNDSDIDIKDLINVKTIGIGAFGTVVLMKDKDEERYAVKVIDKKYIVKTRQVNHILNEKKILSVMNFPFIVHLLKFTSDNSYLYYVMPFIAGGDIFSSLRKFKQFDETLARFYASQVVLAIEYLHHLDLVYRDLKPENVLVDHTGYIKLTDFGFGKVLKTRTWTLCGTPEYLAPEIVLNKGYSKSVDWWALGVFIFEMVTGRSPFLARDPLKIYERILANRYFCPSYVPLDLKDLIKSFLQPNISQRIGCLKNGVQDIKAHHWFRPIEWKSVLNRKMDPPYVPDTTSLDTNFGMFKSVTLKISDTPRFCKEFEQF